MATRFLVLVLLAVGTRELFAQVSSTFRTSKQHRKVTVETFGTDSTLPVVILLHGSDGPAVRYFYDQSRVFAAAGYQVLYPHYYDAAPTKEQSEGDFDDWVDALRDMVTAVHAAAAQRKVFLVGYSQGSEIALAAGATGLKVDGIAEFYGTLFDSYARDVRHLPPLLILHGARDETIPVSYAQRLIALCEAKRFECENHIYPEQGHGFSQPDLGDADRRAIAFFASAVAKKATHDPE